MGNHKVIIFDVDGVLADTEALHQAATSIAAGCPINCIGGGSTLDKLRRAGIPESLVAAIYAEKKLQFDLLVDNLAPNPELLDVLEDLHIAGVRFVACSNSNKYSCHKVLKNIGVLPWLEFVIAGNEVANMKPAPDIYREAVLRLGVSPLECQVFEDTVEGMYAALGAGIEHVTACSTVSLIGELRKWLSSYQQQD